MCVLEPNGSNLKEKTVLKNCNKFQNLVKTFGQFKNNNKYGKTLSWWDLSNLLIQAPPYRPKNQWTFSISNSLEHVINDLISEACYNGIMVSPSGVQIVIIRGEYQYDKFYVTDVNIKHEKVDIPM